MHIYQRAEHHACYKVVFDMFTPVMHALEGIEQPVVQ